MMITLGLLLQSIPYLGQKKIFKVFTKDHGLLTFFSSRSRLTPFCLAEWTYRDSQKEMLSLKEAHLLDPLFDLKENYETLNKAGAMIQALLSTQLPHKQSEPLFDLIYLYLRKLPLSPDALLASFRLKLLLHEGLLSSTRHPQFTPPEWEIVEVLAFSRSIQAIQNIQDAPLLKIGEFFQRCLEENA